MPCSLVLFAQMPQGKSTAGAMHDNNSTNHSTLLRLVSSSKPYALCNTRLSVPQQWR